MKDNKDNKASDTAQDAGNDALARATSGEYKYGFTSDIDTEVIPAGRYVFPR